MVYHYHRQIQHGWQPPWPNNSATDNLISMKFGRPRQNDMLMTINRSKSKPEVEFQYDGRLFQQPEVVISTTDWVILSKFGLQTDYDLLKQVDPALWLYLHWRCRYCYCGWSIHSFIHSFLSFFVLLRVQLLCQRVVSSRSWTTVIVSFFQQDAADCLLCSQT